MSIPVRVKEEIWRRINGDKVNGTCFCCSSPLTSFSFDAGHIISRSKGGPDTVDNLRPICSSCNSSMGTQNLLDFKLKYFSAGSSQMRPEPKKNMIEKLITSEKKKRIKEVETLQNDIKEIEEKIKIKLKRIQELESSFCESLLEDETLCAKNNCQNHSTLLIDFEEEITSKPKLTRKVEASEVKLQVTRSSKNSKILIDLEDVESDSKKKTLRQYIKEFVADISSENGVKISSYDFRKFLKEHLATKGEKYSSGHFNKTVDDELGDASEFLWCIDGCKKSPHWEKSYKEIRINSSKLPSKYHQYKSVCSKDAHLLYLGKYGNLEESISKLDLED